MSSTCAAFRSRNKDTWGRTDPYEARSEKTCRKCRLSLASVNFFRNRGEKDGLNRLCKLCEAAYQTKVRHRKPVLQLLRGAKDRSRRFDLPFDLRLVDIEIPATCPVLGIPLEIGVGKLRRSSPSLDRINPAGGYTRGNIRVISHRANTLKSNASLEELELVMNDLRKLGA
jgi:hypothetical protein